MKPALKGQCHEIFDTVFYKKTPSGPHMNWQKQFCLFLYIRIYVGVVVDYADTLSA